MYFGHKTFISYVCHKDFLPVVVFLFLLCMRLDLKCPPPQGTTSPACGSVGRWWNL
jgi:hypothetical protein